MALKDYALLGYIFVQTSCSINIRNSHTYTQVRPWGFNDTDFRYDGQVFHHHIPSEQHLTLAHKHQSGQIVYAKFGKALVPRISRNGLILIP